MEVTAEQIGAIVTGVGVVTGALVTWHQISAKKEERADARLQSILNRAAESGKEAREDAKEERSAEREELRNVSMIFQDTIREAQRQNSETIVIQKDIMEEVRRLRKSVENGEGCGFKKS